MCRSACAVVLVWIGLCVTCAAQTVKSWFLVDTQPSVTDGCHILDNSHELDSKLASAGWKPKSKLPQIDWKSRVVLLTSSDQTSRPAAVALNPEGDELLVAFTASDQRNSGVFLLEVDGAVSVSTKCRVFGRGGEVTVQPADFKPDSGTKRNEVITVDSSSTSVASDGNENRTIEPSKQPKEAQPAAAKKEPEEPREPKEPAPAKPPKEPKEPKPPREHHTHHKATSPD